MSVGVHSGALQLFLVGQSHRELLVVGPAATSAVHMEHAAGPGQILVSPDCAAQLPSGCVGAPAGPGFLLHRGPRGLASAPDDVDVALPDVALQDFVPLALRTNLLAGLHDPEHRPVTVAFVSFAGADAVVTRSRRRAATKLEALVGAVQAAADRHGVTFLGSDIDADGGKLILVTGAPVATGDEDERMLLAVRELADARVPFDLRIGVNRGRVFAGDIGPAYRRTYTVMGDAVNLAARLMAHAAPGQILTTEDVVRSAKTTFATQAQRPFTAKGKREPVHTVSLGRAGDLRGEATRLPMLGRDRELQMLLEAVDDARCGEGRVVELVGPPGIGKSRLVAELRGRCGIVARLQLVGHAYDTATAYAPFRGPLRALLGIDDGASGAAAGRALETTAAEVAPHLRPWLPILAPLIAAEVGATSQSDQLAQRFRQARLHKVAIALMAALLPAPALLVVEDAHWMDDASAQLLTAIAQRSRDHGWVVCATRRDTPGGWHAPGGDHVRTLALEALDPGATLSLASAATESTPLSSHDMSVLVERSAGNPLFLKELAAAATSAGGVQDLPSSVEAVIAARIDQLPSRARTTLRQLAVLGQSFDRALAGAVLPATEPLDDGSLADFVCDEGGVVQFRHALIRDVAYEALSFRTRRTLHAAAGTAIGARAQRHARRNAERLSFHFLHAQRFAEAWRFSVLAADEAKAIHANAAAAELYARALTAARHLDSIDASTIASTWEALGDVRDRMGSYHGAADAYRAARRSLNDDAVADARLMLKLAWEQGWLRRYSQSLRWIRRGLEVLQDATDAAADRQRAQLIVWYGHFLQEQGRHAQAITRCREAITAAQACGEDEALAHGYRILDWAHVALGEIDLAVHSDRALAIYAELGDLPGQAAVLNNMGAIAYLQGRWDDALAANARASEIWTRIGDDVSVVFSEANTAEVLFDQGRIEESEELMRDVLRVSVAAGHRSLAAFARRYLGRAAAHHGQHDTAMELLEQSLVEYLDIGARVEAIETQIRIAEAHVVRGDPATALLVADRALERARALGGVAAQMPTIHRVRGLALRAVGDVAAARAAFEAGLRAARSRDAIFDVALALRAVGELASQDGDPAAAVMVRESDEILRRLGVVARPALRVRLDGEDVAPAKALV
jgi:class 3 adenylate cyclase/tetratricopeptide (TPR) repeat protein